MTTDKIGFESTESMPESKTDIKLKDGERLDDLQRNGYRLIQNPERFCFGMDAVLLSGFATVRPGERVLDMGTGTGIIPILLAAKTEAEQLVGLEIQEESADMAKRSVLLNHLQERVQIVQGDLKEAEALLGASTFDVVTCNPPYMAAEHGIYNPTDAKAAARHEILCTLKDVIAQAAAVLKPGGHFFMVHRPFRLSEIITEMAGMKLEPKRMRLVYPYVDKEPNMVLIEGVRGGKSRLTVERPLILQTAPGIYTEEIRETYGF